MQRFDRNRQQLPYARGAPDVAACLDALDDHRIDASPRRDDGLVERTGLHQNHRARAVHHVYVRRRIAPEQDDCRHPQVGHLGHPLKKEFTIAVIFLGDDQVEPERSVRKRACSADPLTQCFQRHSASAEDAEAARVGNRRRELGTRGRPNSGIEDRIRHVQKIAERSAERRGHQVIVVPQGFEKMGHSIVILRGLDSGTHATTSSRAHSAKTQLEWKTKLVWGPGFEPVLEYPLVSSRLLLYSNEIFFVSSCDLLYPSGSVNV
jgi:hypothetical protein